MTQVQDSKYLRIGYFQKSKMLFAIIAGEKYYLDNKNKIKNTYLFSPEVEESILDYYLFAEFSMEVELDKEIVQYLYCSYITEDNTRLHIFDMSNFKEDIDKFLIGSYSEFTEDSKDKILHYFGYYNKDPKGNIIKVKDVHSLNGMLHFYTFLYPEECKDQIAGDMDNSIFSSKEEALSILKGMKEICLPYDIYRETITKKLEV